MGSVCHGYMCILLYVELIWCSGFPEIYAQLEEGGGWGQSAMGICAFYSVKLIWCSGFPEIYAQLEEGVGGVSLPWVYVHSSVCETYSV